MSTQDQINWDGRDYPYVPNDPLQIDPGISLHTAVAGDLDPISFEVITGWGPFIAAGGISSFTVAVVLSIVDAAPARQTL